MGSPVEKTSSCATYFYIGAGAQDISNVVPLRFGWFADLLHLHRLWKNWVELHGFGLKIWCMGSQMQVIFPTKWIGNINHYAHDFLDPTHHTPGKIVPTCPTWPIWIHSDRCRYINATPKPMGFWTWREIPCLPCLWHICEGQIKIRPVWWSIWTLKATQVLVPRCIYCHAILAQGD